jgi:hypothetical protein
VSKVAAAVGGLLRHRAWLAFGAGDVDTRVQAPEAPDGSISATPCKVVLGVTPSNSPRSLWHSNCEAFCGSPSIRIANVPWLVATGVELEVTLRFIVGLSQGAEYLGKALCGLSV